MRYFNLRTREIVSRNRTVVSNFSYLSFLQGFNILLPLVTYPYLIRVLGTELYGHIIYAQAIALYFGILIDYGFRITATKEIAVYRQDKQKLSEIISSVLVIKLILWLLSFFSLLALVYSIPSFRNDKLIYIFSFGLCFNEFLFPQWYFQGIERMKYITVINIIARTAFLILIFILVREKSDYLFVPLLNGIGAFISGCLGLTVIFLQHKIRFKIPKFRSVFSYFKKSTPIFGSNAVISVKDKFNVLFIGSWLGMNEVAIYDLATKIMGLFMQPIDTVNTAIYPKMAKSKDWNYLRKTTMLTFFIILFLVIAFQPFIGMAINFLGEGLTEAITPTRLLLISPLLMVWSLALGRNCLIVHEKYKVFTIGMFLTVLFYALLIGVAYHFNVVSSVTTFVLITVLVYLFELIYRFLAAKHLKLI